MSYGSIGLLAALLLLLLPPPALAQTRLATVTRVSDGDTLWVRMDEGGARRKLRLLGIDAPELCQPHGAQARAALTARVLGRRIEIESHSKDGHGRALAQVTLEGQDIANWMVAQGHAWSPGFRWHPGRYAEAQRQAQASRAGLWAQNQPMLPRDFRASHGPCPPS